jgi:ubiquinone/menaquinone biosynthesis C-methylase UbiE
MTSEAEKEKQLADEAIVRNLAAQALAIWSQEELLVERYKLPIGAAILDVGCGTGEVPVRLAAKFPGATVLGADPYASHVEFARRRHAQVGERLRFEQVDPYQLPFADASYDLVVCRHLLQAVPYPERIIDELDRVTKPGGRVHLLAEDYGMFHFAPTRLDIDVFWREVTSVFGPATNTDLRIGRRAYTLLAERGFQQVSVEYVHVDTLRVNRDVCVQIVEAWRDGYSVTLAERSRLNLDEVRAYFDDMIGCIRNPRGYAVWQIPIATGIKPNTAR